MVHEFKLELEKRKELGKQAVKQLRNEGKIPGVFYSATSRAIPFTIDRGHLHQALQSESHVYGVTVAGKKLYAIFKELQYHPVTDEILHVDLFGIRLKDKIDLFVPVVLEGESVGVKLGGILTQNLTEIQIRCLATEVPDAVHLNVTDVEVGESIHVEDLDLGDIEILTNPDVTIITVQAPKAEIEVEEVEEVEVEEEEEGVEEPVEGEKDEKEEETPSK